MYDFIFNFFYRYHKRGRDFSPRFTAALAVAITIFFQLFMVANIISFFTGFNLAGKIFSEDYFSNKLYMFPYGLVYGYLFVLFYSHKRALRIVNKYPKDYKIITLRNVLFVLLIMILPLLIGVQFLQHTHR